MKLMHKMLLLIAAALAGIAFLTWFSAREMAKSMKSPISPMNTLFPACW